MPLRGTWRLDRRGTGGPVCDVIVLNEAFASKAVAVIRDANPNPEKTNPNPTVVGSRWVTRSGRPGRS
ncbi:hypothetical protein OPAG_02253 [Rhodococcus opacus PD630]|nr:hypothetical protein OPAG_02253 [Rhodococcus opacus PD630]